jgi:hypothetical protein
VVREEGEVGRWCGRAGQDPVLPEPRMVRKRCT